MNVVGESVRKSHDIHSELNKATPAEIYPGSLLPGKFPVPLRFAILLVMLAVGMVLVIACANGPGLQLARFATLHVVLAGTLQRQT